MTIILTNRQNTKNNDNIIVCKKILLNKKQYHMETSQPICKGKQLAGFPMIQAFTENFFCTDNVNN